MSLTCDNASVNDVIVETTQRSLLGRYNIPDSTDKHIRCMAHVINLIVQAFLASMDEAVDPDEYDSYVDLKSFPIHYDGNTDEEQHTVEQDEKEVADGVEVQFGSETDELIMADLLTGASPLKRLRFITTKIVSSLQRRIQFRKIAQEKYSVMRRALKLKEATDSWTFNMEDLRVLVLSKSDWALLEQLADILEIFTQATKQLSHENQPTLPFALPLYEKMEQRLCATIEDRTKYHFKIRKGAEAALEKLHKYRAHAEWNQYCHSSPSLRLLWFRNIGGCKRSEKEKVEAVSRVKALFEHVAETYFDEKKPDVIPAETVLTPPQQFVDELQRYLDKFEGGRGDLQHPLEWWKIHAPALPTIARMARDYLAIPATSVSVERTFSKSRHIYQDFRSSLKAETISLALLTKVWIQSGLFDVRAPLQRKRKHGELE
ncbi:hypothetical protein D9619_012818 [Psilocybe cf. subviscida]|uniref:HAT C-terminal dimerisation domain-containing protein n=1 Tax=Psilocybe cf. subviscida TaxID=2480587 RepID=A0A8H5AQF6_9AGAR|nr:hypothetical protein D9619_012818 [Psilocybe cf. subviscida]